MKPEYVPYAMPADGGRVNDIHRKWVDDEFGRRLAEEAAREEALLQKRREERKRKQDAALDKQRTAALLRSLGVKSLALVR
jgi:hypothetical protein